ncbi:MAG TPA: rod shape-determining protein MreC, partial [Candidatus Sumerlaeota bacterium]|nr:rod shape-determining protein MreC [Candidatus Sumerlaeota bacterium]
IRRNFHLVTAGMDASLFPGELPVGTISEPARDKHGRITAAVSPAADFTRLNVLFILTGTQTVKEHRADEIP